MSPSVASVASAASAASAARAAAGRPWTGLVSRFFASAPAGIVGLVGFAGACGASPAAPQAPVAAASSPPLAPPPPAPDLSPVADPERLVLSGRLSRPSASLAVVHGWSQLPLVQADQITELLAGEALGPLVDLDAPIDFALGVEGEGMGLHALVAVSAGLKDPDVAKVTLGERYSLVPASNGALLIQGLGHGRTADDGNDDAPDDAGGDRLCEIAPAYGTPAVRLVCAEDAKALADLGPWLTRTAPRAAMTGDLTLALRTAPLRPTLVAFRRMAAMLVGGFLGSDMAGRDRDAAIAFATALLDFAIDLDGATLEVDLSDPLATAKTTLRFSETPPAAGAPGARGAFARLLLAHADGGAPAPAAFWQLPADSDLALFERGVDAADLAQGAHMAVQIFDKALADAGLKDADRNALLDALAATPSASPLAYASGMDADVVDAAVRGARDAAPAKDPAPALRQALLGWRLLEIDEPSTRLAGALKAVAAAWGRPGVAAAYASHAKGTPAPTVRAQPLPRTATLPKGSLHYVIEIPASRDRTDAPVAARKGKADPPLALHVLLAPDASRTWMGVGGDAAALASRITAAIGSPGDPRSDLAPLDHDKVGAAGFFDVRSLPEVLAQVAVLAGDPAPEALSMLEAVANLPHKGLTPIELSLTAQPPSTAVGTLRVPRSAIEDALMLGLSRAQP